MKTTLSKTVSTIGVVAWLVAGTSESEAQTQPAVAANNQDEEINIHRTVDQDAESFAILRSGDKKEINRYVTRVYNLDHANPYEILPYLRTVAALEKGSVITAWNPQPDGAPLSWIQVNVPEFQIPYIDQAVKAYDVPGFASIPGDIKFSYRTRYRDASDIAAHIRSTTLSPDGLILADSDTNTIYVQDSPSDFKRVLSQIQFYDIPVPQIDIEVTIIELTKVDQTSLGLDWDAWKTALAGSGSLSADNIRSDTNTTPQFESWSSAWEGMISLDATAAARFLNYLVDTGDAEVMARTTLTISNGKTVILGSETQVPEYEYQYSSAIQASELKEVADERQLPTAEGMTLIVHPNIALDTARLEVELLTVAPVAIGKTGDPIYSTQSLLSDLTLSQEQLYKIGGLRRKVEATERKGLPLLRDVPFLKYLFSNEATILRDTELYVFLKPTWTAPLVPDLQGMKIDSTVSADHVTGILAANPNIAMSLTDAELLQEYFDAEDD